MNQTVLNHEIYSIYLKDSNEKSFNKGFMAGLILGLVSFFTLLFLLEVIRATSSPAL
jgi:hypothetical protein